MEISFCGKRALVTGASQGIGRAIAVRLAQCGAMVTAVARSQENWVCSIDNFDRGESTLVTLFMTPLYRFAESLKQEAPTVEIVAVDCSDWNKTEDALKNVGPIDLLVNNAGLAILGPLTEVKEEDVDRVMAINVKAVINVSRIVVQDLLKRKVPGSIVSISSQASVVGLLDHTVYCASKGAVDGFTRAAALEYGPHGIRVNAVNPTVIMTDMGKLGWSDPKKADPLLAKIPLRRFGEVHEVVDAVLYLLSDRASMITGTCLPIDGGYVSS